MDLAYQPPKFRHFVTELTSLVDRRVDEEIIFELGGALLADLVGTDDWLEELFAQPDDTFYQQYLLYSDPQERFSVVSFVWGPGQCTPIHNHGVWALIGMLRGAERSEMFARGEEGQPMRLLGEMMLEPGTVEHVSPRVGDIHRVSNAYQDRVSISIHVYGGNIGRLSRHTYNSETSATKAFISGYSNVKPLR